MHRRLQHESDFTSGSEHENNTATGPLWDDLYAAHADLVLNGHNHQYERFGLQNPSGAATPTASASSWSEPAEQASTCSGQPSNSQVRNSTSHGVLKLTLHAGSYDWEFRPSDGRCRSWGYARDAGKHGPAWRTVGSRPCRSR